MKKVIRLTEADLARIVKKVIKESQTPTDCINCIMSAASTAGIPQFTQEKAQKILDILSKGQIPTQQDITSIINMTDIWKLGSFGMALIGCQGKCMPSGLTSQ